VMNKIDLTEQSVHLDEEHDGLPARVWLSAVTGEGIFELSEKLSDIFAKNVFKGKLRLHPALARLRAQLYEDEAIVQESISDKGEYLLEVCIQQRRLDGILGKEELTLEQLQ